MRTENIFSYRYPPFADTFDVKSPFMSGKDEQLIKRSLSLISQGKSLCIYGEPGTGKSMMLKALVNSMDTRAYKAALIPYGNIKRNVLLRELCEEFDIDVSGRGSLISRLRRHFSSGEDAPFPVIIIDDAHEMEKESFFDLCSLLHHARKRTTAASLVLCGHGCMKKMLGLDIFSAVATRMAAQFRMFPLDADESVSFIRHRMEVAQVKGEVFDEGSLAILSADANGNRRQLMNLCAMAMEIACERQEKLITSDLVNSMNLEEA